ncbi:WXG100 family type VII secretion target [Dietzia cinnamea]|uniref:PPE family protein n=1 Tax=Dietzia cinnamea TaxID=321318 RepID=A0A4R3ZWD6_9ACTN|nr:hypothetical protein [Dietzia cinnamea]TCW25001.1 hypothetical protein EDD19_10559 [Dietzia cinnamea]
MSLLFAAAGGLIEAQDEALAGALSKAAEEPAGLQSLGLIHASESDGFILEDSCVMGGYGRVGPEDVSDSPLERIAQCAQALEPEQFSQIQQRAGAVSEALYTAATQLQSDLNNVLGHGWQGEFASSAQDSVRGLVSSAVALSGELEKVAEKAGRAHQGFVTTRTNVAEQAAQAQLAQLSGREFGPAGLSAAAASRAQQAAAEEQARAIVNTEYSPAVMDANLDDLDFTAAYRVVSTSALGGPDGIDMARVWNTEGISRPAPPAAPNPATLAALTTSTGEAGGAGGGGTTTNSPGAGRDAATEQALLASRTGAADGGATATAGAGQAGAGQSVAGQPGAGQGAAGSGVNAATTPAGAPMTPMTGANGQRGAAGAGGGIRGIRGGANGDGRGRDRGFGSTSGLLGGGGAAAAGAGAGASRMGGAGTLAGFGAGGAAGPGGGGPAAGAPGAGPAPGGTASPGAGALSSSSTTTAQAGRAGAMPIGGMMGAANAGQNSDRRGHTPASYLTNATNTTAIIGEPVKVAPAVLGRPRAEDPPSTDDTAAPYRGRTLGRDYTGGGATRD